MKIRGYKRIYTHEDISVYQRDYIDMSVVDLVERELSTNEEYEHPKSILDVKPKRRRHFRSRSSDEETPEFTFKLNGDEVTFRGFIYSSVKSTAAQFICEFMIPQLSSEHEVEKTLYELGDTAQTAEGQKIIESRLDNLGFGDELLKTDLNDFSAEEFDGEQWLIREGHGDGLIVHHAPVKVSGYELPVLRYAQLDNEMVTVFDGRRLSVMSRDDQGLKRILHRLNDGCFYSDGVFCPVPNPAVNPLCWLRVPTISEYEALKSGDLSAPPPLPEAAPRFASAIDSLSMVIIEDSASLPMISDPSEAVGVLSRMSEDTLLSDLSAELPSETTFEDEPRYWLLFDLRDIDEV